MAQIQIEIINWCTNAAYIVGHIETIRNDRQYESYQSKFCLNIWKTNRIQLIQQLERETKKRKNSEDFLLEERSDGYLNNRINKS